MSVAALVLALAGGLATGRAGAVVAGRFVPCAAPHASVPAAAGPVAGRLVWSRLRRGRLGATELVMAAAWLAVLHSFGLGWAAAPPLVAAVSLVTASAVDLRAYRLPDLVTLPALAVSLCAVVAASLAGGRPGAIVSALACALGYGAVMLAAHELQPHGLGFGDVKLAPLLGLHIGWVAGMFHTGWSAVLGLAAQALLSSCAIGAAMGLALGLMRRRGRDPLPDPLGERAGVRSQRLLHTGFPFGPALAAGTMLALVFSDALVG